jgi:hypothetical protein
MVSRLNANATVGVLNKFPGIRTPIHDREDGTAAGQD